MKATDNPTQNDGPLVAFYRDDGCDNRGRTLDAIHHWSVDQLESVHDYIQWLFPLNEPSQFNPAAPLLDKRQCRIFSESAELHKQVLRSLEVMLRFYGLQCGVEAGRPQITRSADFAGRSRQWITPGNHNYLRLTRILTSLGLMGLDDYAAALFACLGDLYRDAADQIGPVTLAYWAGAVGEDPHSYLPPKEFKP